MTEYRLTNVTDAEVHIVDMGLLLRRGESRIVSEHLFTASQDVKTHASWLRVERVNEGPPVRIWPFSRPVHPEPSKAAPAPPPALPLPSPAPVSPPPDMAQLAESMKELTKQMAQLTAAMAAGVGTAPQVQVRRDAPVLSDDEAPPPEPVYVPSQIVPQDAKVSIRVQHDETEKSDFDAAAEALRNIRRKR